ncbi:MAG: OadG family protein [Magnetococcales bacterium]|nr:OadG family protein [Magnetococcales bacterium]
MDVADMLSKGVELMFLGMGTVFVFLAVLVFSVTKMSQFVQKYEASLPQPEIKPKPTLPAGGTNSDHIAAITAAIHQYRSRNK